jgi:hypothetical protein
MRDPNEATFYNQSNTPAFRLATPALEGYNYRIRQLMRTYNISNSDTFIDKILTQEERHFSSKIAEINLCRNPAPDFPEKFFFDKSIGNLPISTLLADIYSMVDTFDPKTLAELLVDQFEGEMTLPKRKSNVSVCKLDDYKGKIVQMKNISKTIVDSHLARREEMRKKRKENEVKVETAPAPPVDPEDIEAPINPSS